MLNGHTRIDIDLAETTRIDCTGLGALIPLRNRMTTRQGGIRLVDPSLAGRQLLHLTCSGGLFNIITSGHGKNR